MSRLSDTVRAGSYVLYQNAFTGTIIYGRLAGPDCTSVCRRTRASATRSVRGNVERHRSFLAAAASTSPGGRTEAPKRSNGASQLLPLRSEARWRGVDGVVLPEGPGLRAIIIDLPNIAPFADTFIAEAGLPDRVSTLAADGVGGPPACRFDAAVVTIDDGSSVNGNVRGPLHRHRCMLVLRRRGTVGTLRLRWLRMSPSRGEDSETQACKNSLPERASLGSSLSQRQQQPRSPRAIRERQRCDADKSARRRLPGRKEGRTRFADDGSLFGPVVHNYVVILTTSA